MSKSDLEPDPFDETYQLVPVQSFTCKAIRVVPGMQLAPRLGRPIRNHKEPPQDGSCGDTAPNPESPRSEPPLAK